MKKNQTTPQKSNVQYDDFGETFGKSRQNLHWTEIDTALDMFLEGFMPTTGNLADIGCGNGRLLKHIAEHPQSAIIKKYFSTLVGLDTSSVLLNQAREDKNLNFFSSTQWQEGDMHDLERELSAYGGFDGIFFVASFHHLQTREERVSVLKQAKKLLSPTGKIVMLNWNLSHPAQSIYQNSKTADHPDGSSDYAIKIGAYIRFYHAFSPDEYTSLAEESGLQVQQIFGERNTITLWY